MPVGNEQLLALYNLRDELTAAMADWKRQAAAVDSRWPQWQLLQRLLVHAKGLPDADILQSQVNEIMQQRRLLTEPDLVRPLLDGVAQLLRSELNRLAGEYDASCAAGEQRLAQDANWAQVEAAQQDTIRQQQHITAADRPQVAVGTTQDILNTLDAVALTAFGDRAAALHGRFDAVLMEAARLIRPQTRFVKLPRRTFQEPQDVDAWLEEVGQQLKAAVAQGPVAIQ